MNECNNGTSSVEALCGGIGQCSVVEGVAECACPEEYAVLLNCEKTHYGVEPELALVVSVVMLIPFVLLTILYSYEYIWGFVRRPKTRWSLLQVFKLVMLFFVLTRVWGCLHNLINIRIGQTGLWGGPARQVVVSAGLMSMLVALAMVVSLWFDMVLSIQNIDSESSSSSRNVRWGLMISGGVLFVVGVSAKIYTVFLRTLAVVMIYTIAPVLYTIVFIVIAVVSLSKSRKFWSPTQKKKSSAASEFTRKVKIMIGWVCVCTVYILSAIILNLSNFKSSSMFFITFTIYNTLELLLACLSLAFNQHYIYPFKGLSCFSPNASVSETKNSKDNSQFTMSATKATKNSSTIEEDDLGVNSMKRVHSDTVVATSSASSTSSVSTSSGSYTSHSVTSGPSSSHSSSST
eukprot:TRINITY_DN8831_c0_g1_i2.p1 TRINITY_DN8831_c0_g1~~TRINITY_DN8831_c0_g1_i2.p1  ORF type:complete len:438 (+),score=70.28 TRINITY_DN8831_c0_g1_i2:104-1315(+)